MATLKKRGNTWQLNYSYLGKQTRKSLGNISEFEAQAILKRKEYELNFGIDTIKRNNSNMLFSEMALDYDRLVISSSLTNSQIIDNHLIPFFDCQLVDIDVVMIDRYVINRLRLAKRSTINRELNVLRAILNRAVNLNIVEKVPKVVRLKELDSKPPAFYSMEVLEAIYQANPVCSHYWRFLANTGLRLQEFLNLKWEDIRQGSIYVVSSTEFRTKSGKYRQIPINDVVDDCLKQFKKMANADSIFVVPRIRADGLKLKFRRICQKAKVEPKGIHTLRHTFCSHLVQNSVPMRSVQLLAGHSSIKTTEKYAHLSSEHLEIAVQKISL